MLKQKASSYKIGTMINKKQQDHVIWQVNEALEKGATLEFGNLEADFIEPIILSGVTPEMNIFMDETFGPVACVTVVSSPEEAVNLANSTNYALGAVIFGADVGKATKLGRRLNAGMVGINKACSGVKGSPWVGAGQSGYGFHGSLAGHRQFAQIRILSVAN